MSITLSRRRHPGTRLGARAVPGATISTSRGVRMRPADVGTAGVVGCGIMGSGIVEVCAKAGMKVVFVESNEQLVSKGRQAIERSMAKAVERGKLDESSRDDALGRISGTTDFQELADADLIIEAVVEDLPAKRDVFHRLDE